MKAKNTHEKIKKMKKIMYWGLFALENIKWMLSHLVWSVFQFHFHYFVRTYSSRLYTLFCFSASFSYILFATLFLSMAQSSFLTVYPSLSIVWMRTKYKRWFEFLSFDFVVFFLLSIFLSLSTTPFSYKFLTIHSSYFTSTSTYT